MKRQKKRKRSTLGTDLIRELRELRRELWRELILCLLLVALRSDADHRVPPSCADSFPQSSATNIAR